MEENRLKLKAYFRRPLPLDWNAREKGSLAEGGFLAGFLVSSSSVQRRWRAGAAK
jgi:hypothetical protein